MAHSEQSDRSVEPDPAQLDMFGAPPAATGAPDPAGVRAELSEILGRARAVAPEQPWEAREASHYRTVLDPTAGALPEEEAAQLRLEFATELARKDAA